MPILNPRISLIIPCYNYAHYLAECLDSVLRQTYPLHEIIVVSDKSPDTEEMKKVLANYPTVKLIEREVNGGLGATRNTGIKEATGDYIMCLDSDDKLVPGAIEEHVKLLKDEWTIAQNALMEFGERHTVNIPNPNTNLQRIMQSNTIYCNALFPKKAWVEVGGYDESETLRAGYEDWEIWIRMLHAGYSVNTSEFIALRYRVHEGQMTQATAWPKRQILYRYIYEKHKALYEEFNLTVAGML
jgi:glycosyltransferase involved in cell wall biosynthesis